MRVRLAALILCIACRPLATSQPAPTPEPPDAGVYAALLNSISTRPAPDMLLLGDSTLSFRVPRGAVASWRIRFDSIPSSLPQTLEAVSRTKRPSSSLPLPRPARIVTHATLREIFVAGRRDAWDEFYRRYPRQREYLRFTPVAFSADSLDALVYYEYHCGLECGGGDAVWLSRRGGGGWRVQKVIGFWVS